MTRNFEKYALNYILTKDSVLFICLPVPASFSVTVNNVLLYESMYSVDLKLLPI